MGERWDFADCYAKSVRSGGATSDSAGRIALRLDDAGRAVLLVLADGKELVRHQVGRGVRSVEERQQRVELLLANLTRVTVATAEAASLAASLRALRDGALENVPKWVPEAQRLVSRSPKTKFLLSRDRTPTQPTKARPEQKAKGAHPLHSSRWLSNFNLSGRNTALSQRRGWSSGGRKAAIPHARLELLQGPSRFSRQPSASAVPRPRARAFPWGPAQPKREEKQAQGHAGSQGHASDAGGKGRLAAGGLANLGNTCFLSSVLQALSNTPLFRIMILSLEDADVCSSSVVLLDGAGDLGRSSRRRNLVPEHVSIALELKKAFKALWSRNGVAYSPDSFLSVVWRILPRFYGYHQQDAHEFLRHMLDRLRTELSETAVSNFIHDTFQGQLLSEVTCLKCHTTSRKHDPFLDLSLVIPSTTDDEPVSLQACLKEYVAAECLEKSEKYVCGHCSNNKEKAMKKFTLEKLPVILCLHLKRFKWTPPTRSKVATMVDFPAELNLAPFCTGARPKLETTYYLYALISHHGEGTGSGHYTSHCFNDDGWYHYNDSCVQQCPFSEVQRQQAYILFYIQATAVEPV
mmetsp:Transcript_18886/g.72781  ORF Transcript_18886/g.72781 Transcript_18886/m.72781 type:complete len:578 (+) Transcript_18886:163-1896(+)